MLERPKVKETVEQKAHMEKIATLSVNTEAPVVVDAADDSSPSKPLVMPHQPTPATTTTPEGPTQRAGRWTPDEKILFLYGLKRFGKGRWKKMSIYLPHRSLVQIKSHAQKVLKRLESGENVFRRLEENYSVVDSLIVQAAKQRDAICSTPIDKKSLSSAAKQRKRAHSKKSPDVMKSTPIVGKLSEQPKSKRLISTTPISPKPVPAAAPDQEDNVTGDPADGGRGAVIAAAALCQLSSLGGWNQQ